MRLSKLQTELRNVTRRYQRANADYLTALRAVHSRIPTRVTSEVPLRQESLERRADAFLKALFDERSSLATDLGPQALPHFPTVPRQRMSFQPQLRSTQNTGTQTASTGAQFHYIIRKTGRLWLVLPQDQTRAKPEPTRPDQTNKMTRVPEDHFASNQRWPIMFFKS
jgi:hypothetical protein